MPPQEEGQLDPETLAILEQLGLGQSGAPAGDEDFRFPLGGKPRVPTEGTGWRRNVPHQTRDAYRDDYLGEDDYGNVVFQPGDATRILQTMPEEQMVRLQDMMIGAGLVSPGGLLPGYLDDTTIKGFTQILTVANYEGKHWRKVVADFTKAVDSGQFDDPEDQPKFTAPAYVAPDYATLAQKVKATMRDTLGREPDDDELQQLVGELQGWDRGGFEQQVDTARAEFDAEVAGAPTTPGEFQQVDPLARFQEAFEQRYANEIDFVEERDERVPLSQESVQGAVGTLSDMSREA